MKKSKYFRLLLAVFAVMLFSVGNAAAQSGQEGPNHVLVIQSTDRVSEAWDNQFFITLSEPLPSGTQFQFSADIMADKSTGGIATMENGAPGAYLHWSFVGTPEFGTEWKTYVNSGTTTSDNVQTIAFTLNEFAEANTYYFDNMSFIVDGKELIVNGDCEGNELSAFNYLYDRGDVQPVTAGNVTNFLEVTSIDVTNVSTEAAWFKELAGTVAVTFEDGSKDEYDVSDITQTWGEVSGGKSEVTLKYRGVSAKITVSFNVQDVAYTLLKDSVLTFYYNVNPPDGMYDKAFKVTEIGDWYDWKREVKKAVFDKSFADYKPTTTYAWFANCTNMTEIVGMKENLNTENVIDMGCMFSDCNSLTNIDLSGFNTESAIYTQQMFYGCNSLTSLDISSFNTANVYRMGSMFSSCNKLKTIYVGDGWTTSAVWSSWDIMFYNCNKLYGSKGSSVKELGVTDKTYARIDGGADAPGYFTKVGDEPYVAPEAYAVLADSVLTFYYAKNPPEGAIDIESDLDGWYDWKDSVKTVVFDDSFKTYKRQGSCGWWFAGCHNLTEIIGMKENFNTETVNSMCYMFSSCYNLNKIDLSGFNTENVVYLYEMFSGCRSLTTLDLSSFSTTSVTALRDMFSGCSKLRTVYVGDKWNVDAVDNSSNMFNNCNKLYGSKGSSVKEIGVTDKSYARIDGGADAPGYFTKVGDEPFIPTEAYAVLQDSVLTFYYAKNPPEGSYDIESGDNFSGWSDWKTQVKKAVFDKSFAGYKPTTTYAWFANCTNMTEIVGMKEYLNTVNVVHMGSMFSDCNNLTSLDLSGLNTAKVYNMQHMFNSCRNLSCLDISSFNTSGVYYMSRMFANCNKLKTIYVGDGWTTAAVNMDDSWYYSYLFDNCNKLYGSKGSSVKELGVTDMTYARIDGGADAPGYFTKVGDEPFIPTEAYAVLQDSVLTFYYAKNPPEGSYEIENGDNFRGWNDWKSSVKKAVFDKSFADYKPTTTYAWFASCYNMTEIVGMKENLNTENVIDMGSMFSGCNSLTNIDLSGFNTERANYTQEMFNGCNSLVTLDISSFNTANVYGMGYMFAYCNKLKTIYVGDGWTTAAVNMDDSWYSSGLFAGSNKLYGSKGSSVRELGVTDATYARIDGGADAPGYFTKVGDEPFIPTEAYGILADSTLTLYYGKNTISNSLVERGGYDRPEWDDNSSEIKKVVFDESFKAYKPKSTYDWFYDMYNLTEIVGMKENLNTELDTNMSWMFGYCRSLKNIDLGGFNTANVKNMERMFYNCDSLTSLDLSSFNTENVSSMYGMFAYCYGLTTLDLSNFNTENVTNMGDMFCSCNGLSSIYAGDGWTTEKLTDRQWAFYGCNKLVGGQGTVFNDTITHTGYAHIDGGVENPGYFTKVGEKKPAAVSIEITRMPTKLEYILGEYPLQLDSSLVSVKYDNDVVQTQKIAYTNVTGYNPVSVGKQSINVEYLGQTTTFDIEIVDKGVNPYTLFNTADSTLTLYYGNYKEGSRLGMRVVDSLQNAVKSVVIEPSYKDYKPENTANMFAYYGLMTEIVGMENLNTEKDTTMAYMFAGCYMLSDIDLSHFNTENVKDMNSMFNTWSSVLTTLDLTSFNTSKVTNMYYMFTGNYGLKTIYVGENWNTDAVTSADYMFGSDNNLVGGKGTRCNGNWWWGLDDNIRYAHIDEGTSNPGYFTRISDVAAVEVAELPKRVEYLEGDDFDVKGGKITITYGDNTTRTINLSSAIISGYDPAKPGKQTITAEYEGKTFTFEVNVIAKSPVSIAIATAPTKVEYEQGEDLAADGGSITVYYDNGTSATVGLDAEGIQFSGFDKDKAGTQSVTVEYLGFTTVFEVTVSEKTPVSELAFNANTRIWSFESTIYIENGGASGIRIFDVNGRIVKTVKSDNERIEIPMQKAGIYIVRTATKTQKVMIH